MIEEFKNALVCATERVAAWSDLLDAINVYPVADGDTGRNLTMTLSPLRHPGSSRTGTIRRILLSARGNSGNIAAQFLSGLLTADSPESLVPAVSLGSDNAWQAVHHPVAGTMLSVLDAATGFVSANGVGQGADWMTRLTRCLEQAVHSTHDQLPRLRRAGVVDAGALGMFVFLEAFFATLYPGSDGLTKIGAAFEGRLEVASSFEEKQTPGYCVDTVIRTGLNPEKAARRLGQAGEEVVTIAHGDIVKIHLHTPDRQALRRTLSSVGTVLQWSEDDISRQIQGRRHSRGRGRIHIVTDAAGSITREDARDLGMTLLDSYISLGEASVPETLLAPEVLYREMAKGVRVSTAQASVFERHQHYERLLDQYAHVLYLCVGSVFTGNYHTALAWKKDHDRDNRFTVIDTGAASGRLGALALAVGRLADTGAAPRSVIHYAREAAPACFEYIFLGRLKYLAAGGRLSRTSAVFGDMLNLKPVISPTPDGAKKIGSARSRDGQLAFALEKLGAGVAENSAPFILLEFSDNRAWVETTAFEAIRVRCPKAEIRLQPLSLTTGVHTGPGTWALAILPDTEPVL